MANNASPTMFSAADNVAASSGDIFLLLARLSMGWLFLASGWMKITNVAGTVGYLTNLGVPSPDLMVWLVLGCELRNFRGLVADPDAGARTGRHTELGGDPDHDLDLLVGDRDVGRLHRIAVRRLDHGAVAPDRRHRLDPERVRLAVSGEQALIEPGQQTEFGQLLR